MAISTKRTAAHAFSIESLMSKQTERDCVISPPKSSSVTPPATPTAASLTAHLLNMKSIYEAQYLESLGLGINHPALAGALPSSLPGHISSLPPPPLHPLLLAGASSRDALFNPWLLARQQTFLGHRFGKLKFSTIHLVFIAVNVCLSSPLSWL